MLCYTWLPKVLLSLNTYLIYIFVWVCVFCVIYDFRRCSYDLCQPWLESVCPISAWCMRLNQREISGWIWNGLVSFCFTKKDNPKFKKGHSVWRVFVVFFLHIPRFIFKSGCERFCGWGKSASKDNYVPTVKLWTIIHLII